LFGVRTLLHLTQPLARLSGRWSNEHPLRWQLGANGLSLPRPRTFTIWSERWRTSEEWLQLVEAALRAMDATPLRGGDYDRWDLEVRGGRLGAARLRIAVEEHGAGRQLLRLRAWPRVAPAGLVVMLLFAALSVGAAFDGASWVASALLGTGAAMLALRMLWECAAATNTVVTEVEGYDSLTNLSNIVDQSGSR
jgi:O-antigen biosynthesis protein